MQTRTRGAKSTQPDCQWHLVSGTLPHLLRSASLARYLNRVFEMVWLAACSAQMKATAYCTCTLSPTKVTRLLPNN